MAAGYFWRCSKCIRSFSTAGPWEFYRDHQGNRKSYGHPGPASDEATRSGVWGLSGDVYCPDCDKTFKDLVLVDFKKPYRGFSVWIDLDSCDPKDGFNDEGMGKCPEFGGTNLILESVEDKQVTCPRCKKGKLIGKMDWIS